jgi:hypothetical protein
VIAYALDTTDVSLNRDFLSYIWSDAVFCICP